jgi:hypothetical protein
MKAQLSYVTFGKCMLCNKNEGTDLHEIINKAHLPDELCPIEFRSLLCRDCHTNAEMKRVQLIRINLAIYGWPRMNEVWSNLSKLYQFPTGIISAVEKAINTIEKE